MTWFAQGMHKNKWAQHVTGTVEIRSKCCKHQISLKTPPYNAWNIDVGTEGTELHTAAISCQF
jgi:hypothetical protein